MLTYVTLRDKEKEIHKVFSNTDVGWRFYQNKVASGAKLIRIRTVKLSNVKAILPLNKDLDLYILRQVDDCLEVCFSNAPNDVKRCEIFESDEGMFVVVCGAKIFLSWFIRVP